MNSALILTAALDDRSFERFDALRKQHFPPERNFIPAHLTLFHALPTNHEERIRELIVQVCERSPVLTGKVPRLKKLGQGVAFEIEAPELTRMHDVLKEAFGGWCTAQDRLPFRPHVTIQNKVLPAEARELFTAMQAKHQPFDVQLCGIEIWRYMGGPWNPIERIDFTLASAAGDAG